MIIVLPKETKQSRLLVEKGNKRWFAALQTRCFVDYLSGPPARGEFVTSPYFVFCLPYGADAIVLLERTVSIWLI